MLSKMPRVSVDPVATYSFVIVISCIFNLATVVARCNVLFESFYFRVEAVEREREPPPILRRLM